MSRSAGAALIDEGATSTANSSQWSIHSNFGIGDMQNLGDFSALARE
jgi:hypothetical protein